MISPRTNQHGESKNRKGQKYDNFWYKAVSGD